MIEVDLGSLVDLDKMLKAFPERTRQAASIAINQTARREALTNVRRDMMRQVNWKTRYLQERTGMAKVANKNSLSLNPRLVGRVFRLQPVKNSFCFQSFKRCILDSKFFNYQKHCLTKS